MSVKEKIRCEYEAGASYRQLAKKYRKSFSQIAGILHPERKPETSSAAEVLEARLSALEDRLSRIEGKLNHVNVFIQKLRSSLEAAYEIRVKNEPGLGCIHMGRYENAKCLFKNPSKLQCALCPYYVPKWLPGFLAEKMELAASKPYQR